MLVGVRNHDGDAVGDGDSVHELGQQPEPLSGDDALLRGTYRRLGCGLRTLRWCGPESTKPRLANLPTQDPADPVPQFEASTGLGR